MDCGSQCRDVLVFSVTDMGRDVTRVEAVASFKASTDVRFPPNPGPSPLDLSIPMMRDALSCALRAAGFPAECDPDNWCGWVSAVGERSSVVLATCLTACLQ